MQNLIKLHMKANLMIITEFWKVDSNHTCERRGLVQRPSALTVLLEYIDSVQFEWQHKTNIWERLPCPYHFILPYSF